MATVSAPPEAHTTEDRRSRHPARPGTYEGRRRSRSGRLLPYALVSPVSLYLLAIMALPFLWALYVSLTDKKVGSTGHFVGLDHYTSLLTDGLFWTTVRNTAVFTVGAVVVKLLFGLAMALLLNERFRGRSVFRLLLFLPWTVPTIVSVFTWQWMFSDVGGVLNSLLRKAGLVESGLHWLSDPTLAMVSVITVNAWRGIPFIGIALLAGLQAVPQEQYEAARMDGAGTLDRFRYITLPSIRPVAMLAAVITTIWTLNDFEIIWLLTRGGPANATQVLSTLSYTIGFQNLDLARAIAIAVLSIPPLVLLINYVTRRALKEQD